MSHGLGGVYRSSCCVLVVSVPAATTEVHLRNLTPNTKYTIKVYAVNSVGEGAEMNLLNQTDNVSECCSKGCNHHRSFDSTPYYRFSAF